MAALFAPGYRLEVEAWALLDDDYDRANGIRAEPISPGEAVKLFPLLYAGDLAGAVYYPDDGRGNATDTTMALAGGIRQLGGQILENVLVTGVTQQDGRVTGVATADGPIEAEYVVNATGMWGREFAPGTASASRCRPWPTTTS